MKKNDSSKKKSNQKFVSQKNLIYLHLDKIDEEESRDNIKMENKKYKTGEKKIYSFYTLKGKSTKKNMNLKQNQILKSLHYLKAKKN